MLVAIAILLPIAVREVVHWRTAHNRAGSPVLGGTASGIAWNVLYIVLAGAALGTALRSETAWWTWTGCAVLWSGAGLRAAAYSRLGSFYSVQVVVRDDHRIIDTGPYRFLRHPLHLGLVVEMVGLALAGAWWPSWVLVGIAFVILIVRNIHEESILRQQLGDTYVRYAATTWDPIDVLPVRLAGRP